MKNMKKYLTLLFFLRVILVLSQDTPGFELPNFAAKTPEAAAFLKYGEYPVELSTGVPGISIPLYTLNLSDYNMPITLNYHASGIKVNQEATWTGLGWNLNYGAQVVLSVRDDVDENNQVIDQIPNSDDLLNHWSNHPYDYNAGVIVNEQLEKSRVKDVYNFSSSTVSGSFYIRNFAENDVVTFPPDASFKVTLLGESRQNMGFKITDLKGNEYLFNHTKEISARTQTHSDSYISAWFVDQITTAQNNIISFNYQNDGTINDYSFSERIDVKDNCVNCGCTGSVEEVHDRSLSGLKIDHGSTMTNAKKISEILYNNGKTRIVFEKVDGRLDLVGMNGYLSKIKIENFENGQFILKKGFEFNYSYFISNDNVTNLDYKKKRLKLESVEDLIEGNGHEFVYSDIEMPSKNAKSQDYFGYYNGIYNTNMIPKHFISFPFTTEVGAGNRSVNTSLNQAGILKEIHYPTKGLTKFTYETNQYFGKNELERYSLKIVNGNLVQGTGTGSQAPYQMPDIDYFVFNPDYNPCTYPNPNNCIQIALFPYEAINADGLLNFEIVNTASSDPADRHPYARVSIYSGGSLIYTTGIKRISKIYTIPVHLLFSGQIFVEAYGQHVSVKNLQLRYVNNDDTPKNNNVGGLRIKKIENINHDGQKISQKIYDYNDFENPLKTSGKLINSLSVSFISKPLKSFHLGLCIYSEQSWGAPVQPKVDYTKIYSYTSNSSFGIEGNTVIYQTVTERQIDTDSIDNGYTRFKFSTEGDLIPFGENSIFINRPWLRGKVLEKSIYKKQQNSNIYKCIYTENNNYIDDNSVVSVINGFKFWKNSNVSGVNEVYNDPFEPPFLLFQSENFGIPENTLSAYEFNTFNLDVYRNYLKSTKAEEFIYDDFNNLSGSITKIKTYNYNNPTHLQLTSEVSQNSTGETLETNYYYPQDQEMANEPHVGELEAKNMIGIPLQKTIIRNNEVLSQQKTIYNNWGNNLLLPESIQTSKGSGLLENRIRYNAYDNYGHPLEVQQENGMIISYLWGYNQSQPIAKIENITNEQLKSALGVTDLNLVDETDLTAINALRNNPSYANAMITTYTYKPLVGVSTITDPRGMTTTYEYDSFGRLKWVKDYEGNILSENEYHYRTQN